MIRYLTTVLALTICLGASISGAADASVPFIEDFESYSLGALDLTGPWGTNDSSGSATVQSTNVLAGEDINEDASDGTKSLEANLCDLTLSIDAAENVTNGWFLAYSKPTPYNDTVPPAVPTDVAAAFYLSTDGDVEAINGGSWSNVATGVTTDEWLAFAVQINYVDDEWNLFLSQDNTFGTVLTKLNSGAMDLRTGHTQTALTSFTLEGVALLDAVAVQEDTKFQNKDYLVVKTLQLTLGQQTKIGVFAHDYSPPTADTLGADLGADLRGWVETGDDVALYLDGNTESYTANNDLDGWDDSGASVSAANAHIPPGTGIWVTKNGTEPYLAFMDYDSLTVADKVVNGTGTGGGMNFLAWDKPGSSGNLGTGGANNAGGFSAAGAGTAGLGDKLYIDVPGGKAATSLKRLWWNANGGNAGYWMDGSIPATSDTLATGQTFWYYRGSDSGSGNWDVGSAN
ncbi:MAG: hypothetical protein QGH15_07075 [Kiritimatiellia bacterium]|jgi:hypothetical protein|nr:hypothetical protein [Kiritimatiellia bacterium]